MSGKTAETIKNYLNEKGIQKDYVIDKTSFSERKLNDTLNGKRKLLADEFVEILLVLKVDANYFIDRVNNYYERKKPNKYGNKYQR